MGESPAAAAAGPWTVTVGFGGVDIDADAINSVISAASELLVSRGKRPLCMEWEGLEIFRKGHFFSVQDRNNNHNHLQ